jgi:hypothetical protein
VKESKETRTYNPSELENKSPHRRNQNLPQHLLIVTEDALEVQRIVRHPLRQRSTERAEVEGGRSDLLRGGESVGEGGGGKTAGCSAVDDDGTAGFGVERLGTEVEELFAQFVDLRESNKLVSKKGKKKGEKETHKLPLIPLHRREMQARLIPLNKLNQLLLHLNRPFLILLEVGQRRRFGRHLPNLRLLLLNSERFSELRLSLRDVAG